MLKRGKLDRGIVETMDTESLVLVGLLLRKIEAAVDFNRIYEMVEPKHSGDTGRPGIAPAVLFKMPAFVWAAAHAADGGENRRQHLLPLALRGDTLQAETPRFSTESYHFHHHFTMETVDRIFAWILEEAAETGYRTW